MKIAACLLFAAAAVLCIMAWWAQLHPAQGSWISLNSLTVALYLWPGIACAVLGFLLLLLSRYTGTNSIVIVIARWTGIVIGAAAALAAVWILFMSVNWPALGKNSETTVHHTDQK